MSNDEIKKLEDSIKRHEGYRNKVYLDTKGNPTCGWGHLLAVGSKVPREICEIFLKQDIADAISEFMRIPKKVLPDYRILNVVRRRVITELIFNMGLPRVLGFVRMWARIREQNWPLAAMELLDSKWAREDVGKARSRELSTLLRLGED